MIAPKSSTYPVFLSSLCRELWDLRARIYDEIGGKTYVYVDEQANPRDISNQDHLEAADELIGKVREADIFVCLLGGTRHGSAIKIDDRPSSTSFFEIELFQAALLNKEIHLFVRNDFAPEPRLQGLLNILRFAFPEWANRPAQTEDQIVADVQRLVDRIRARQALRPVVRLRAPINRLVQALYAARARGVAKPSLFFLDGALEPRRKTPDEGILSSVVARLEHQRDEEKRLSRLWIGLRELMCLDYRDLKDKDLLKSWNYLFGEWARSGAWYGLHGDTPLGCLAALNSLTVVRDRLSSMYRSELPPEETAFPGGPLATAKYSIAKRLYVKRDREARFNEALQDLDRSLTVSTDDKSGLLAIRGSIYRQVGRISEAVDDYEEVLRIRSQANAPASSIGDALSELGFGYLRQGQIVKALHYCKNGVEHLRQGGRAGFLARGLKKLSVAYLVNGRLIKAYEAWQEARSVALGHRAFDQL